MAYATGKDMLLLPDGSTYHLGTKAGDIYPRMITVGLPTRAEAISTLFDKDTPVRKFESSRQMYVFTGKYKGVGVSIVAIGMGAPMMDFFVREASFCEPGPIAIIRFGTCGLFDGSKVPGTVMTAGKGASYIYKNYGWFDGATNDSEGHAAKAPAYIVTEPVQCSEKLNSLLSNQLKSQGCPTDDGLCAAGETFYATQGRINNQFRDSNESVLDDIKKAGITFVEMETHQLFHLGKLRAQPLHTACCCVGIVNRVNPDIKVNITTERMHELETEAGKACLEALIQFQF